MENKIRRQLTMFAGTKDAIAMEDVRKRFNPKQQVLIDCHVTLCREDEIENLEPVLTNLAALRQEPIVISFGQVTRFDNGRGVMLPALGKNEQFQLLRLKILAGVSANIRKQEPHITLMHPRNSSCTDAIFSIIQATNFPTHLCFYEISLIEQIDGGKWQILKQFKLNKT